MSSVLLKISNLSYVPIVLQRARIHIEYQVTNRPIVSHALLLQEGPLSTPSLKQQCWSMVQCEIAENTPLYWLAFSLKTEVGRFLLSPGCRHPKALSSSLCSGTRVCHRAAGKGRSTQWSYRTRPLPRGEEK